MCMLQRRKRWKGGGREGSPFRHSPPPISNNIISPHLFSPADPEPGPPLLVFYANSLQLRSVRAGLRSLWKDHRALRLGEQLSPPTLLFAIHLCSVGTWDPLEPSASAWGWAENRRASGSRARCQGKLGEVGKPLPAPGQDHRRRRVHPMEPCSDLPKM